MQSPDLPELLQACERWEEQRWARWATSLARQLREQSKRGRRDRARVAKRGKARGYLCPKSIALDKRSQRNAGGGIETMRRREGE